MGRIRTIKPEFFTSEDIVELAPIERLLYIALWCEADREGRLTWKPKTFKIRYFPSDDFDIQRACDALVTRGLVSLYGDGLAFIPSFLSHQHINPRESVSKLPNPNDAIDASVTREPRVSDTSSRDSDAQVGKERKGKERKEVGETVSPDGEVKKILFDRATSVLGKDGPALVGKSVKEIGELNTYACLDWADGKESPVSAFMGALNNAKLKAKKAATSVASDVGPGGIAQSHFVN